MAIKFIYQDKKSKEVFYINTESSFNFECRHHFTGVRLYSSLTYTTHLEEYEDIITILSKEDYNLLKKYNESIIELESNIKEGSLSYNVGNDIATKAKKIIEKLFSEENTKLYDSIIQKEKECVVEQYNISAEEVEDIFNNYPDPFKDRYIISYIYNTLKEFAKEELRNLGIMDNSNEYILNLYFDFEQFGEDAINERDSLYELEDGRIVCYRL